MLWLTRRTASNVEQYAVGGAGQAETVADNINQNRRVDITAVAEAVGLGSGGTTAGKIAVIFVGGSASALTRLAVGRQCRATRTGYRIVSGWTSAVKGWRDSARADVEVTLHKSLP